MTISFNAIPNSNRVPFIAAEFDNSRASQGPAQLAYRVLLMGAKLAAGTGTANTAVKATSADQVLTLAGRGSQLHRMAKRYFENNTQTETWVLPVDDAGGGTQGTKTITLSGTATASGTLSVYIGGDLVSVGVASGDAAAAVATALNAAVNANLDLPVTSGVATATVTLTARNRGTCGNDLDVRLNYQDGEKTPAGLTAVVATGVTGATNPTLTTAIANMGDNWFHIVIHPWTDATSLTAIETEMARRFGPMVMLDGVAITSAAGTQSALGTLGDARNSQHSCIVAQPGKNPVTPPAEFAAMVGATVAKYAAIDPARPLQTLALSGAKPPVEADRFTFSERNLELYDGISTTKVAAGGVVQIERLVTTYQTNAAGAADTSYLDVSTMLTLMYLRYSFRTQLQNRYPRHKLGSDGARFGAGQAVITPKLAKAEALAWFRQMEDLGLVEGFDQFKTDLVVERNASDPNRLDILLPPDLINQFIYGAVKVQFRL